MIGEAMCFSPEIVRNPDTTIVVSHGSGGIGKSELNICDFFLQRGHRVTMIDYFSPHGIGKLFWDYGLYNQDEHDISFKQMFDDVSIADHGKLVHIGCSLGGFFGIYHSNRFVRNYCFYPGVIGFTQEMVERDLSNTTVFLAGRDQWCDNYHVFHDRCISPPHLISVDCYHGFMIPGKDITIPVAKYRFPGHPISDEEFGDMSPHHQRLSERFGFDAAEVTLQYDQEQSTMLLHHIWEEIKDL